LAASISTLGEFGYPEHTLKPPFIRKLNTFYGREIAFEPYKIRSERDGIRIIINTDKNSLSLYPLSHKSLINKIFELADFKSEISQPGLLLKRIIEKLNGLHNGEVFKIVGVRKLLKTINKDVCISRKETETIIRNGKNFNKYENLYIEKRDKEKLTPSDVFEFLLNYDFLRPGLELICEYCKLRSWISLNRIDDILICDYCGYENKTRLHLRKSPNDKGEGDWKFRKSGFFAKDNNQEGAIPVILTLLVFSRILNHKLIYSPALSLKSDSRDPEIDFCVLNYKTVRRGPSIQIGIGECKAEGGKIDKNDIDNMKIIRKRLSKIGLDCFLVFSKTVDNFDEEEINMFKRLDKDNIDIILLTNRELESSHPYWYKEYSDNLPQKYALDLKDMADNSKYLYLNK